MKRKKSSCCNAEKMVSIPQLISISLLQQSDSAFLKQKKSKTMPTIADIARACGLGTSTVSRALNAQARVKPATREKVLAAARELGYRPNPAVAALVGLRERKRSKGDTTPELLPVAVLTRLGANSTDRVHDRLNRIGTSFGYRFEHFETLDSPETTARALGRTLHARGFVAVVLRRIIHDREWFRDFPWQQFVLVSLDASFDLVPVPIVRTSHFEDTLRGWQILRSMGHRRIGAMLPSSQDGRRENQRRIGAWRECQSQVPPDDQVPIFSFNILDESSLDGVADWVERERPDALFSVLGGTLDKVMPRLKKPLPAAAIIDPSGRYPHSNYQDWVESETVQLIDRLFRSSSYGLPPRPVHHAVSSDWVDSDGKPIAGKI